MLFDPLAQNDNSTVKFAYQLYDELYHKVTLVKNTLPDLWRSYKIFKRPSEDP